jgi:hypothetical protein
LLNAVLLLCASLVHRVRATFGMWLSGRQRDWHTLSAASALPQTKPDIHLQKDDATHGVILGLVPGISVGPTQGLAKIPREIINRDSRDALRLPENDIVEVARLVQTLFLSFQPERRSRV